MAGITYQATSHAFTLFLKPAHYIILNSLGMFLETIYNEMGTS